MLIVHGYALKLQIPEQMKSSRLLTITLPGGDLINMVGKVVFWENIKNLLVMVVKARLLVDLAHQNDGIKDIFQRLSRFQRGRKG